MSRARKLVNRSFAPAKWFSLFAMVCLPVLIASGDITRNLVAHYALDDGTGVTAKDSSVGKHDGTLEGYYSDSAGWITGKIDGALSFDGTDDYVSVPHHNDFDLKTYTLAAWVSISSGSEVRPILVKGKFDDGVNATDVPFALYLGDTKKLTLAYEKSASSQRYAENMSYEATGEGLTEGEIYHVAVTRNNSGGLIAFYVDGQSRGSFESTPKPGDNNKKLYLGLDPKTNKLFKGGLDDVRIYARALEASEIQDLYALGANSSQNDSDSGSGSRETNDSGKDEDSGKTNDSGKETENGEESESSSRNDGSNQSDDTGSDNGKAEEDGGSKNSKSGTDTSEGGESPNTNESSKAGVEEDETGEQSPSQPGESGSSVAPEEEGINFNGSGQQTVPSNENPETNDSRGDDKDSNDDSKETDAQGNRSGDSDDSSSKSGETSEDGKDPEQSEGSSRTDEDKASSEENEKESDSETGKGGDDLSNRAPRNLTLTKNSIYEGREAGSVVGEFQVVDDDDPDRGGSYLIELISNNSAGRRVGRSTSSTGEEDSSKKSEEVDEDNKNDQRGEETDDKGDEKTAGESSESSSRKDGETKSGETKDSGKNDGSTSKGANESASQSSSTDDDKATSANSSNGSKKESSSEKDSKEDNGGGWFSIDEEGRLATTQVLDYESRSSYSIRVRATDKGGLSVEKDFVIEVKNAFAPIVRTVSVANRKAHRATVSGKILANGHSTISEVGVVISKQPRFKLGDNGTESIQANNGSAQFDLLVKGLEPETTYYFRAFAINGEGLSYGALERFTTKSDNGPWSKTESAGNGWLHSEWLGHLYPTENNWMYHAELGWLYAKQNDSGGVWLYSKEFLGWFWTGSKVYPFVYSDRSRSWVYYQGIVAQHRVFFHFGQNSWMAVASDGLTKQRESGRASSKNSSARQKEEGKNSGSGKDKADAKSSETTAGQKR